MNHLAILLAAVAGWLVGAVWYMALARPWAAALGTTVEEIEHRQRARGKAAFIPYAVAFAALFAMAWVLAGALGHLGPGQVTLRNGVISALILWVGFVLTTGVVNNMFGMRGAMLTLIDAGHWLAAMLVMGAIIGGMGV